VPIASQMHVIPSGAPLGAEVENDFVAEGSPLHAAMAPSR
jgi:hypothetical protein